MLRARLIAAQAVLALLVCAHHARAQSCGAQRSTCAACHVERGERPIDDGAWHTDHAIGDFCATCHGGDPEAPARAAAHVGLVDPLGAARCASCHADADARVARYAEARDRRPPPAPATAAPPPTSGTSLPDAIAAGLALAIGLAGAIALARRPLLPRLRAAAWSPTGAGVGLGVVITVSLALGHRLSGAAAYQQLAGAIGARAQPDATYFHHVIAPLSLSWEILGWFGVCLGALASALASRTFRVRAMPDRDWVEVWGPSIARRWAIAFLGAALTGFAAGIAGGCTASLAMSGGAVLVPGAFVFMAGMFASGIPTALAVHRGRP